jgi:hypothetical protein
MADGRHCDIQKPGHVADTHRDCNRLLGGHRNRSGWRSPKKHPSHLQLSV